MAILRINKLFGLYTNDIDFSNRCTILIGENGLGKSTIINIINNLVKGDFVELTRNYFESIEIIGDNEKLSIEMEELMPDLSYLEACLQEKYEEYRDFWIYPGEHGNPQYIGEPLHIEVKNRLDQIIKKFGLEHYYKTLGDIYFNKPLDLRIEKIMPSTKKGHMVNMDFHDSIRSVLNDLFVETKHHSNNGDIIIGSYFLGSSIQNEVCIENIEGFDSSSLLSRIHKEIDVSHCFKVDMVNNYFLSSKTVNESNIFSREISWLNNYNYDDKIDDQKALMSSFKLFTARGILIPYDDIIGIKPCSNVDIAKSLVDIAKITYNNPDFKMKPFSRFDFRQIFSENNIVNINLVIRDKYYDNDFIEKINNTAIKYYKELIGKNKSFVDESLWFTDEQYNDFLNYFKPIVIRESIFDFDGQEIYEFQIKEAFDDFYKNEFEKLKKNRTPEIDLFEKLLSKYLFNKEIKVFPSGLKVFFRKDEDEVHPKGFKVHETQRQEINLNLLSSGEKKIIVLLFFAIFFENETLLIDEPEISLSLVWQKNLLPDLINKTKINKIIVATHSPFIAENELLRESLLHLSNDGGDLINE